MEQDVNAGEADKGGTTEGPSPSEKEAGLIAALTAERSNGQALKVELAELKGKVDVLSQVKTEPVREFTRSELQVQVDDGRMTPDESDRILHEQMKRSVTQEVAGDIESKTQAREYGAKVQADVDRYKEARPDIMVDGSKDRQLVAAEYARQISELGKPDSLATERDALATLFGPSNRLQNGKDKPAQTFSDTGSDGGGDGGSTDSAPKLPKGVKAHYEKLIGSGMYTGWDDKNLKAEVETYGSRWG